MKRYDVIELEIDWEDRPSSVSQMIPKAPAVPSEARKSESGFPSAGPDPDEAELDEEWGRGTDDQGDVEHRVQTRTDPGPGEPDETS